MYPERDSPYWDRIVGNDWPEISPSAWRSLETTAREGADALNTGDAAGALRGFDESVRSAEALQAVRAAMAALQHNPQAFVEALYAAADTFGDIAELVRRTRNQILDVVDGADARIRRETAGDNNSDGEEGDEAEAETDANTVNSIVARARADVVDIIETTLANIGPQGLPALDDIAEALGQPGPWKPGNLSPEPWIEPPASGPNLPPQADVPTSVPLPDPQLTPPDLRNDHLPGTMDLEGDVGGTNSPDPGEVRAAEGGTGQAIPANSPDRPVGASPETRSTPVPSGGLPGADMAIGGAGRPAGQPSGAEVVSPESVRESHESGPVEAEHADAARGSGSSDDVTVDPRMSGPVVAPSTTSAEAGQPGALPPVPLQAIGPNAVLAPTSAQGRSAPAGALGEPIRANPPVVGKPAATQYPTAQIPGAAQPAVTAPTSGKASVPPRDATDVPARGASEPSTKDSDDLVRDSVGAALAASAAPSFVVGDRVDGDLTLARTLLAGIRAAVDTDLIGVDWAVSIMRLPSGVSAFVTSNEGRGWLPAGLFLPREVSNPWLWSVSENAGWEGVADPARILVEFALAWGGRSGAKLAALASSGPIGPELERRLGDIGLAGGVPASARMDLSMPSASTLDRLGTTGSTRLIERATKVPDGMLAQRCLELAVDAHMRVEEVDGAPLPSVEAPELRLRILRALRHAREFPASWWDELQEADDLLAASALGYRIDTASVALGELRPERGDGLPDPRRNTLRDIGFQRRCNELVLLLGEPGGRQVLRDAVYAHAQILSHPSFRQHAADPMSRGPSTGAVYGPR